MAGIDYIVARAFEFVLGASGYFLLIAVCFVPLERTFGTHEGPKRTRVFSDVVNATLGFGLARLTVVILLGLAMNALDELIPERPHFRLSLGSLALGLMVTELGGYAYHLAAHRVEALWRMHRVHHSSERVDWLATFRQHPVEIVLMTVAQNLPLVLLGVPLLTHAFIVALIRTHTVFVHSTVRWDGFGPRSNLVLEQLGKVIALPSFHHRHHDEGAPTANYASLFPWVDSLLRTKA